MLNTQYKEHVTPAQMALIAELAELGADMIDDLTHDKYDAPEVAPIEGNYKSGWIPSQDGGLCASYLADNGWGSGSYLCQKHREQVEEQEARAYAELPEGIEHDSEEAFEQIAEYMNDPILAYFEAYWEKDGSLTMRHGWNFRDAPYYREKYADDLRSVTFCPDELAGKTAAQLFAEYLA